MGIDPEQNFKEGRYEDTKAFHGNRWYYTVGCPYRFWGFIGMGTGRMVRMRSFISDPGAGDSTMDPLAGEICMSSFFGNSTARWKN